LEQFMFYKIEVLDAIGSSSSSEFAFCIFNIF